MKYILSIIFLAALFVCLIGCANEKKEPIWKTEGKLLIGTDATYPPFEMVHTETGQPEGFDIDIMKEICAINKWTPEFIVTPFDGIISGLKNHKYNCIVSAMTITPERKVVVDFSQPYYNAGQIVAVPIENNMIHSVDDLRGKNVGVQLGTTGERYAKGLSGVSVFSFDNIGAAFIDMENGHIDAVLNDFPTTNEYMKLKGNVKTVGELLSEEKYGIAVNKGDSELLEKINFALDQIKQSGKYDEIHSRWF